MPDSICIADDGSGPETAALIESFAGRFAPVPLRHVWHEDQGFEKCKILNAAINSSQATFLFFIDGDARVFDRAWLRSHGAIDRFGTWLKTMPFPFLVQNILDVTTPVQKALCGANWSAFRSDIMAVNGFDEDIKYGGLDKELGIRLQNKGIKGRHLRYTAPLVHQDHPRGYRDPEKVKRHKQLIRDVRTSKRWWTSNGLVKGDPHV